MLFSLRTLSLIIYIYIYINIHIHTHIYMSVCVCVCVCVRTYVCNLSSHFVYFEFKLHSTVVIQQTIRRWISGHMWANTLLWSYSVVSKTTLFKSAYCVDVVFLMTPPGDPPYPVQWISETIVTLESFNTIGLSASFTKSKHHCWIIYIYIYIYICCIVTTNYTHIHAET